MRIARIVALALMASTPALAEDSAKLESMQGTVVMRTGEEEGLTGKVWAKGTRSRMELPSGKQRAIAIQLGDTMYTYLVGSKTGTKQYLGHGLAAKGLIQQIEEIKAKGTKEDQGGVEDGIQYQMYKYDLNDHMDMGVVLLAEKTSLPRVWMTTVRTGEKEATVSQLYYRKMKANVDIAEELFQLPPDVTFSEKP